MFLNHQGIVLPPKGTVTETFLVAMTGGEVDTSGVY